jgi:hypothetical protein
MKNTAFIGLAAGTALFYCTLGSACQAVEAQAQIPFKLVHDTVAVVPMTVNDQGPFDFILDTGTDTTILDIALAHKLSLVLSDRMTLTTLSGTQTLARGSVSSLALETTVVQNLEVLVQDLGEIRKLDSHIDGIVGENFLSHFNYLLDYGRRSIRIETGNELGDSIQGDRVQLETSGGKILVPCELLSTGRTKLRLLLDSGVNGIVLFRGLQSPATAFQARWSDTNSRGNASGIGMVRADALVVGTQQFRDITLGFLPARPEDRERIEDGLLPTALFRALYVNHSEGFIIFNPRSTIRASGLLCPSRAMPLAQFAFQSRRSTQALQQLKCGQQRPKNAAKGE